MDNYTPVDQPPMTPGMSGESNVPVFDPQLGELAKRAHGGGGWYYAIAAFSFINTLLRAFSSTTYFVVGLAVTLFADDVALSIRQEYGGNAGTIATIVAVGFSLIISGVVAVFGWFGRKHHRWPFYIGVPLYTLDALLMLLFGQILAVLFHALALFSLARATLAVGKLHQLKQASTSENMWQA